MSRTTGTPSSGRAAGKTSHQGHRSRLRERFNLNGFSGMLKYEILELLLTLLLPRKDVKPLAKELLSRYNTITGVLSQPVSTLSQIPGLGPSKNGRFR